MASIEHRPVLIVIAGPNGSGKTSVTSKILHHEWLEDSEYINPDNVARDVFGDWNNQDSVIKAANCCNDWRERCLTEGINHSSGIRNDNATDVFLMNLKFHICTILS